MRDLKAELEQLQADFDEFAYIVSHDLSAPLRGISGITQWIEEDFNEDISDEIRESFGMLKERVDKMNAMILALNVYSRVGRRELEIAETNVQKELLDIKDDIEDNYANVAVTLEGDFSELKTFKSKLIKTLEELAENAAKHNMGADHVEVRIRMEINEDFAKFTIEDSGVGIKETRLEEMQSLFKTGQGNGTGVGAGLPIVKKILNHVGGSMRLIQSGQGLTVEVLWPKNVQEYDN